MYILPLPWAALFDLMAPSDHGSIIYYGKSRYKLRDSYRYESESKSKAILNLRGNRKREGLAQCAVLTMPVEEFSHV